MKPFFTTLALTLSIFTGAFAQQAPANIVTGVNTLFEGHVNQSLGLVPGHVIRIEKPGEWVYEYSAGLASVSPEIDAQPGMKFKIASITKLFTAAAIFKLIESGQLDFNAPIGNYLPLSVVQGFDNYQNIKIKNLLSHTSGIREPQADFQGRLNHWIFKKRFDDIPMDSLFLWSYGDPVGVGNYNYSNANYYVLAEIIRSVTGDTYQTYITNNIINPLSLTNTDFNKIPTGSFMRGYLKGSFYPNGGVPDGLEPDSLYDFTEASNSWGYGAAEIWSNTAALITFHKALFNGQLINMNWVDSMKKVLTVTGDMGSYGYGMIQFNSFNNGPVYGYGHTGTAFGYGAMLAYIPSLDVYMCSAGNYMKIGQEFLQRDIYNFLKANLPLSINETANELSFNLYPNPASTYVNISTNAKRFIVSVYDVTGRLVLQEDGKRTIDVSKTASGLYVLKLQDMDTKSTVTKKFVRGA